jgi:hypothetical protein
MVDVVTKIIPVIAGEVTATGWVPLNVHQENFHVGFSIINLGDGDQPVVRIEGTMSNTIAETSIASTRIFALVSAPETSLKGTTVLGEISFPTKSIRLTTVTGGSGSSVLEFNVLQTGKV